MASFADNHGGYCTCTRDKCTDDCTTYRRFKPKPITNSMRIRTMTDEELATIIFTGCVCTEVFFKTESELLDWLKQEVDT